MKKILYTICMGMLLFSGCNHSNQTEHYMYRLPDKMPFGTICNNKLFVDSLVYISDTSQKVGIGYVDVVLYQNDKKVYSEFIQIEPDGEWAFDSENHLTKVRTEYTTHDFVGYLGNYPAGFYDVELRYLGWDQDSISSVSELFVEKYYRTICVDGNGRIN